MLPKLANQGILEAWNLSVALNKYEKTTRPLLVENGTRHRAPKQTHFIPSAGLELASSSSEENGPRHLLSDTGSEVLIISVK